MNNEREVCHCGHAKDTHHDAGDGECLGLGCNVTSNDWQSTAITSPCPRFRDDRKPDTIRRPRVSHSPRYVGGVLTPCGCYSCKQAAA